MLSGGIYYSALEISWTGSIRSSQSSKCYKALRMPYSIWILSTRFKGKLKLVAAGGFAIMYSSYHTKETWHFDK